MWPFFYLFIRLCVYLFVCLYINLYYLFGSLFIHLFIFSLVSLVAPKTTSRDAFAFRDREWVKDSK